MTWWRSQSGWYREHQEATACEMAGDGGEQSIQRTGRQMEQQRVGSKKKLESRNLLPLFNFNKYVNMFAF